MKHHRPVRGALGVFWLFWVALVLSGCATALSQARSTPTAPSPRSASSPWAPPPCQTQHLLLAFGTFDAATSNEAAQFVLVNQSKQSCPLSGYPAVQLLDARHQPIRAHVRQVTQGFLYLPQVPHQFVLQAGGKAYFVVSWANLGCGKLPPGVGPPGSFASPVSFLRVTPPLNQASLLIATQWGARSVRSETLWTSLLWSRTISCSSLDDLQAEAAYFREASHCVRAFHGAVRELRERSALLLRGEPRDAREPIFAHAVPK
ncbi:DUF4232 domain-containing protein [Ktedonosporobacter rubrisoli]|uniref:DUF4232 domain-containing protein n=1 Tax=Ktedonosporobacter rubrisoli TaxID=2509675 RepID=A0A4P6JPJ6_KTERU|nr:DUF4232 domain-containing protein [Ktedonosporobacter rubrisoli]QBD77309.1 DUF4232 domain-containing protein [Ktedonosporobacter rubrisoli]